MPKPSVNAACSVGSSCDDGITQEHALSLLNDSEQYIRAWTIQLLAEDKNPSGVIRSKFAEMAKSEKSPVVRLYLASALQRMPYDQRWNILESLSKYAEDKEDNNIPRMLWLALEPMVVKHPQKALQLALQFRTSALAGVYPPTITRWRNGS